MRLRLLVSFLAATLAAHAATPALLDEAIRKWIADEDHWAYTQHLRLRNGSKPVEERIERYDPSQPLDRQWQLLSIAGHPPSAAELKSWQRRKAREQKRRDEQPLADYFDFGHATVAAETAETVRYDVPLRREASRRIPLEKIAVAVTVNRSRRELEELAAGLREKFHLALGAAKVENFGLDVRFRVIDEKFAAQPVEITASGWARVVLFFKLGGDAQVGWSDFKRVKPFNDRFDVKLGDLKALDF